MKIDGKQEYLSYFFGKKWWKPQLTTKTTMVFIYCLYFDVFVFLFSTIVCDEKAMLCDKEISFIYNI